MGRVRVLQQLILDKQMFRGFSGVARILAGVGVILAALMLEKGGVPRNVNAHLVVWAGVLGIALVLNFSGLVRALRRDAAFRRDPARMKPVLDIVPPLAVGAVLSLALILRGSYDLLFGVWMSLFGLAHLACRRALPSANCAVGGFYVLCGVLCLLGPNVSFLKAWPMALAFGPGEIAGGLVFLSLRGVGGQLRRVEEGV
jgi:lysylphosphatidylglycerol synthetase-like protein (DUF2156 family)